SRGRCRNEARVMTQAYIISAAMLPFGKYADRSAAVLGREAVAALLSSSEIPSQFVQAVYVGRSFAGSIDGQVIVPGQVALRGTGIEAVPVFNFDNACAAVPRALHFAAQSVKAGIYDLVL